MKRFHVHLAVEDLAASVRFYTALFGCGPGVLKADYAKWMLEDPRVNFAISARGRAVGLDHLGFQVGDAEALAAAYAQLAQAGAPVIEQAGTTCCYAKSDKQWVHDPQGIAWETFLTLGEATHYGADLPATATACCAPPPAPAVAKPVAIPVVAGAPEGGCCTPKADSGSASGCC